MALRVVKRLIMNKLPEKYKLLIIVQSLFQNSSFALKENIINVFSKQHALSFKNEFLVNTYLYYFIYLCTFLL